LLQRGVCIAGTVVTGCAAGEERSGIAMAPDLITVRGHRRPRLYRTSTIHRGHHRAL